MSTSNPVPYLDPAKWFAFQDRCVIAPDEAESVTKGGIIIPDDSKEKPKSGTVMLVGPEAMIAVKIGDHVHYGRHSGQPITIEGFQFEAVRIAELIVGVALEDSPIATDRQKDIMTA
jgi:chaperonin GroES